jgi:hypothetical protein
MKIKHWLYYVTPSTIVAVIVGIMMIVGVMEGLTKGAEGWDGIGRIFLIVVFMILLAGGYIVNKAIKGEMLSIWIIEVAAIGAVQMWLINL